MASWYRSARDGGSGAPNDARSSRGPPSLLDRGASAIAAAATEAGDVPANAGGAGRPGAAPPMIGIPTTSAVVIRSAGGEALGESAGWGAGPARACRSGGTGAPATWAVAGTSAARGASPAPAPGGAAESRAAASRATRWRTAREASPAETMAAPEARRPRRGRTVSSMCSSSNGARWQSGAMAATDRRAIRSIDGRRHAPSGPRTALEAIERGRPAGASSYGEPSSPRRGFRMDHVRRPRTGTAAGEVRRNVGAGLRAFPGTGKPSGCRNATRIWSATGLSGWGRDGATGASRPGS